MYTTNVFIGKVEINTAMAGDVKLFRKQLEGIQRQYRG